MTEQIPKADRTEIIFEANALMLITLKNPERMLSYTILTINEDSIELSDNLADMNNKVKFYLKTIDEETFIMESLYGNENSNMTFKKR